jgi:hypothetical protein
MAGEYHFTLSPQALGGILHIRLAREEGKMMAMATTIEMEAKETVGSALRLIKRNGKWYVSELALRPIHTTLVYSVPRRSKAAQRELEVSVRVIPVQIIRG